MRFIFLLALSLPALAAEHQGPCARTALKHALKTRKVAVSDFSLKLDKKENPTELHVYEIGFREKNTFYHGEISVEYIGGKCLQPKIEFISMLD